MTENEPVKFRGRVLKVSEMGLDKRVYDEMKKPNFSVEALTRALNSEGVKITAQSIRKFIKKTKKAQSELIAKDLRTAEVYKKLTLDYDSALKEILDEVEEVKKTAKEEKNYTTYNHLVGRLMQGIELIAKLSGDIRPSGSIDINLIYNEINADTEKKMKDMKSEMFKGKIIDVDAEIVEDDKENEKKLKE